MKSRLILCILFLMIIGCGIFPEQINMKNPRIQPLLQAAASFDRTFFGFTSIPEEAKVYFESKSTKKYDAMLHIETKTSRTIAFRKKPDGSFKWIGEQEIFQGPKKYTTVDGTFYESICLNYDIESISGYPLNKLNVSYSGEDSRLVNKNNLTLSEVNPILKEWGYR